MSTCGAGSVLYISAALGKSPQPMSLPYVDRFILPSQVINNTPPEAGPYLT
jgi:hypothetical protein